MVEHYGIVERDMNHLLRLQEIRDITLEDVDDAWLFRIECSNPVACPGWQECREDHSGFDPEDYDYDTVVIHGEKHQWNYGYGWVVDYPGCVVVGSDYDIPYGINLNRPGKYLLFVDWDDTDCYLEVAKEIPNEI